MGEVQREPFAFVLIALGIVDKNRRSSRIPDLEDITDMKLSIGTPPGPARATRRARRAARLRRHLAVRLRRDLRGRLGAPGLIADATRRIGIGTAVLVPNLRHVMTTASAIATIDRLAPGPPRCAIGTGYTARADPRQARALLEAHARVRRAAARPPAGRRGRDRGRALPDDPPARARGDAADPGADRALRVRAEGPRDRA